MVDLAMKEAIPHVVERDVVGPPLLGEAGIVENGEAVPKRGGNGAGIRGIESYLRQLSQVR
jgi:hypothetical protein